MCLVLHIHLELEDPQWKKSEHNLNATVFSIYKSDHGKRLVWFYFNVRSYLYVLNITISITLPSNLIVW